MSERKYVCDFCRQEVSVGEAYKCADCGTQVCSTHRGEIKVKNEHVVGQRIGFALVEFIFAIILFYRDYTSLGMLCLIGTPIMPFIIVRSKEKVASCLKCHSLRVIKL